MLRKLEFYDSPNLEHVFAPREGKEKEETLLVAVVYAKRPPPK